MKEKEIKFNFEHGKIIFKIGKENCFMSAENFLDILDRQKAHDIFESLKPEVRFGEQNTLRNAALYTLLKDRGVSELKIAEKLGLSGVQELNDWLEYGFVERIKKEREADFNATYQGHNEFRTKTILKGDF